ncbi:MAG TPA: MmgE/PrpD family protein [Gaiellales bacterium]|jgi:2-methylcitrate dehydratase PrpD
MTVSREIASWAEGLTFEALPLEAVSAAKLHLLDTLGAGLAAHARGVATAGRAVAPAIGGTGPSTVIGSPIGFAPAAAALANGMLCHGLDFDDTHADSICHVGVVIVPAALAVAEASGASGRDLLVALVAGGEITTRVGSAAAPGYMVRGFHPTSVSGVFGAVVAAATLQRMSADEIGSALGIAGSMSSGLFAYLGDGAATKPVHAGWAAHGGIVAAELARAGAEGPGPVFEHRFGFFSAFYGLTADAFEAQVADLGRRWESPRIAFKPYPVCHFVHACLDAAVQLVAEHPIVPSEIERIVVAVPDASVPLVLEPLSEKRLPRTEYDAKFSLPYSLAALLLHGRVGVETYTEDAIGDPGVLALAARVEHVARDFPTYPQSFPGWVRIELRSGAAFELELAHQRGGPENPMTADDVSAKFRDNASLALDDDALIRLESAILSLEQHDDLAGCFAPLRATSTPQPVPR